MGIIEKWSDQPCQSIDDTIHYLPHHAIIRTDKQTTKLRIVYDASAWHNGPSLTDCLFFRPKFDQNILYILVRFHTYKTVLTADIEKAFLMVSIWEEDCNALRFLWLDDIEKSPPVIEEIRFTRVVLKCLQVHSSSMPLLTITWRDIKIGIWTWLMHCCILWTLMMSQWRWSLSASYMIFLISYLQKVAST